MRRAALRQPGLGRIRYLASGVTRPDITRVKRQKGERPLVLVVDDDRGVQDAAREELANRDYEVVVAGDGESAIRLLERETPDVLVLDLQLPHVSGPMVAAKLNMLARSAAPASSARRCRTRRRSRSDVGADGVLLKPFVRADLRAEVERLLAMRRA